MSFFSFNPDERNLRIHLISLLINRNNTLAANILVGYESKVNFVFVRCQMFLSPIFTHENHENKVKQVNSPFKSVHGGNLSLFKLSQGLTTNQN